MKIDSWLKKKFSYYWRMYLTLSFIIKWILLALAILSVILKIMNISNELRNKDLWNLAKDFFFFSLYILKWGCVAVDEIFPPKPRILCEHKNICEAKQSPTLIVGCLFYANRARLGVRVDFGKIAMSLHQIGAPRLARKYNSTLSHSYFLQS